MLIANEKRSSTIRIRCLGSGSIKVGQSGFRKGPLSFCSESDSLVLSDVFSIEVDLLLVFLGQMLACRFILPGRFQHASLQYVVTCG